MVQDPGKPAPGSPPAKQEPPPGADTPAKTAPTGQGQDKSAPEKTEPGKTTLDKTTLGKVDPPKAEATKVEPAAPDIAPVIPLQPPPGVVGVPPAAPPAAEGFRIGSILIPALWLVGILVLGAIILAWLKKRRENPALVPTTTASEQLATFRHAYEEGEMTPEEFQKVKARLSEKLRERDPMSMPPQAKRRRDGEPMPGMPGDEAG